ncbi:MAG: extracellular solute-binding protein [Eubacterium sp.]|nr:extracellular solute-binding protein [Eubacterium sp.]
MKKLRVLGKFSIFIALAVFACATLVACSGGEKEKVTLSMWCSERKMQLVKGAMEEFKKIHADEVDINYTVSKQEEDDCKNTVLGNVNGAADIYCFVDDQFDDLVDAGALLEMTAYTDKSADEYLAPVGGVNSGAGDAVTKDGKVYAYPGTGGNCPFLYYNKKYFKANDVLTLDNIIKICEKNGKKFSMDFGSGWYLYTFFKGAGLDITKNVSTGRNECNWNATDTPYTGVEVVQTMINLARRRGFVDLGDEDFVKKIKAGEVIAGVNGAWNSEKIKKVWGDDLGATKLPTFTLDDSQVQMCSFTGYKAVGINAHTKYPEWCMKFVEFCMTKDRQIEEFKLTEEAPANLEAIESKEVQQSTIISAIAKQSRFGYAQRVADPFWDASNKLGVVISSGNRDGKDLQKLLDKMVKETIS